MTNQLEEIAVVAAPLPVISNDQHRVLMQISQGKRDKNIAADLGMNLEKVKREETKLRNVLYARSRAHLVAIAIRYGLIEHPNPSPEPMPQGMRLPPYAFYVLPRNTLDQAPDPNRVIAVVAVWPQRWSIRWRGYARSTKGTWDKVPEGFTPEWLDTHTWEMRQVFDIARGIVCDQQETIRRRSH